MFSLSWRRLRCAAPTTHQDQGALTSRVLARRLPHNDRAPENPRFPAVSNRIHLTDVAKPSRSSFSRAHGRGVARLHQSVAGHLSRVETLGLIQKAWLITNFSPSLQPQPNGWPDLQPNAFENTRLKGHEVSHDVIARPVTTYGPQIYAPRPCCWCSWRAYVGKIAARPG